MGAGTDNKVGVFAAQLSGLVVETLLQQRATAADALVLVHEPVFLPNGLENGLHRLGDAGGEMRHAAAKIGHAANGVERLYFLQVFVTVDDIQIAFVARDATDVHQIDVHGALFSAAMAYKAVLAGGDDVFVMLQVTEVAKQIDGLYIGDTQIFI